MLYGSCRISYGETTEGFLYAHCRKQDQHLFAVGHGPEAVVGAAVTCFLMSDVPGKGVAVGSTLQEATEAFKKLNKRLKVA